MGRVLRACVRFLSLALLTGMALKAALKQAPLQGRRLEHSISHLRQEIQHNHAYVYKLKQRLQSLEQHLKGLDSNILAVSAGSFSDAAEELRSALKHQWTPRVVASEDWPHGALLALRKETKSIVSEAHEKLNRLEIQRRWSKANATKVSSMLKAATDKETKLNHELHQTLQSPTWNASWSYAWHGATSCGANYFSMRFDVVTHQQAMMCIDWCEREFAFMSFLLTPHPAPMLKFPLIPFDAWNIDQGPKVAQPGVWHLHSLSTCLVFGVGQAWKSLKLLVWMAANLCIAVVDIMIFVCLFPLTVICYILQLVAALVAAPIYGSVKYLQGDAVSLCARVATSYSFSQLPAFIGPLSGVCVLGTGVAICYAKFMWYSKIVHITSDQGESAVDQTMREAADFCIRMEVEFDATESTFDTKSVADHVKKRETTKNMLTKKLESVLGMGVVDISLLLQCYHLKTEVERRPVKIINRTVTTTKDYDVLVEEVGRSFEQSVLGTEDAGKLLRALQVGRPKNIINLDHPEYETKGVPAKYLPDGAQCRHGPSSLERIFKSEFNIFEYEYGLTSAEVKWTSSTDKAEWRQGAKELLVFWAEIARTNWKAVSLHVRQGMYKATRADTGSAPKHFINSVENWVSAVLPVQDNYSDVAQSITFLRMGRCSYCFYNVVGILWNVLLGLQLNFPEESGSWFALEVLGRIFQADVIEAAMQCVSTGCKTHFFFQKVAIQSSTETITNTLVTACALITLQEFELEGVGISMPGWMTDAQQQWARFIIDFVLVNGNVGLLSSMILSLNSLYTGLGIAPQWVHAFEDAAQQGSEVTGFSPSRLLACLRVCEAISTIGTIVIFSMTTGRFLTIYSITVITLVVGRVPALACIDLLPLCWPLYPPSLIWPTWWKYQGRACAWFLFVRFASSISTLCWLLATDDGLLHEMTDFSLTPSFDSFPKLSHLFIIYSTFISSIALPIGLVFGPFFCPQHVFFHACGFQYLSLGARVDPKHEDQDDAASPAGASSVAASPAGASSVAASPAGASSVGAYE